MSLRERIGLTLGVLGAILLVAYPLAYRLTTENATPIPTAATVEMTPSAAPTPVMTPVSSRITPPSPSVPPVGPGWYAHAMSHRGANGSTFEYVCPPNGVLGDIWGTDIYTDDSSVCTAGVHRGVITRESGGPVAIVIRPGQAAYVGSTRNGVRTSSYAAWGGSYEVLAAGSGPR